VKVYTTSEQKTLFQSLKDPRSSHTKSPIIFPQEMLKIQPDRKRKRALYNHFHLYPFGSETFCNPVKNNITRAELRCMIFMTIVHMKV